MTERLKSHVITRDPASFQLGSSRYLVVQPVSVSLILHTVMKIFHVKLTGLRKLSLVLVILTAFLFMISLLDKTTVNNINNFVNILELHPKTPNKNVDLEFRVKNIISGIRKDQEHEEVAQEWVEFVNIETVKLNNRTKESRDIGNSDHEARKPSFVRANNTNPPPPKLVIMILSGTDEKHEIRRNCVRSTYLSVESWREHYNYFFLIGRTNNETLEQNISQEGDTFQDIVRYPEIDTYNKLSSKVMWGFEHISKTWDRSYNLILKTDDDSFVNVENVISTFRTVDLSKSFYGGGKRFPGRRHGVKKREQFKDMYSEDFLVGFQLNFINLNQLLNRSFICFSVQSFELNASHTNKNELYF